MEYFLPVLKEFPDMLSACWDYLNFLFFRFSLFQVVSFCSGTVKKGFAPIPATRCLNKKVNKYVLGCFILDQIIWCSIFLSWSKEKPLSISGFVWKWMPVRERVWSSVCRFSMGQCICSMNSNSLHLFRKTSLSSKTKSYLLVLFLHCRKVGVMDYRHTGGLRISDHFSVLLFFWWFVAAAVKSH